MCEIRKVKKLNICKQLIYGRKNINIKAKGSSCLYPEKGLAVDFKIKVEIKYIKKKFR